MRHISRILIMTLLMLFLVNSVCLGAEKWSGNDVVVGNKLNELSGTKASKPILNFSGDLGLFVFAIGGFTAGVVVGYQWRKIFIEKKEE